jgi:hypothetical protein
VNYTYSRGLRSSRAIERLCRLDASYYRFFVGDDVPDHSVIAHFRQCHAERMKGVFPQGAGAVPAAGLIWLGLGPLNGIKAQANAALDANRTASTIGEQIDLVLAEAEEQATGRHKRGRKPQEPGPSVGPDTEANTKYPQSSILQTRRVWVQGYNAQAVVTTGQIILAADVTTEANDVHQLTGMLDWAQSNVEAVLGEEAVPGAAVAEAGYWSEANADS